MFILQRTSISSIIFYLHNACGILCHCVLLDCESLIHVHFIPFVVVVVVVVVVVIPDWRPRFPLNSGCKT